MENLVRYTGVIKRYMGPDTGYINTVDIVAPEGTDLQEVVNNKYLRGKITKVEIVRMVKDGRPRRL